MEQEDVHVVGAAPAGDAPTRELPTCTHFVYFVHKNDVGIFSLSRVRLAKQDAAKTEYANIDPKGPEIHRMAKQTIWKLYTVYRNLYT